MKRDPGDFLEWLSITVKQTRAMHTKGEKVIPLVDITADVPCGDCVSCCKSGMEIPLSFSMDAIWLACTVGPSGPDHLAKKEDGKTCYYLDDDKCTIYDQRPIVCRSYDCRKHLASKVIEFDLRHMAEQWQASEWYHPWNREILLAINLAAKDAGECNSTTASDYGLARFPEFLAIARDKIQAACEEREAL